MAAGQGYIEFSTGDVLTAAAANGYLASQVVMVFASAAARTSAIASPQEGMFSYLKDTNATEYYTGSAWAAVGGGGGGGGKVLQVVQATYSTATTIASTTYTDTGLSASITPSASTSKVLVIANIAGQAEGFSSAVNVGLGVRLLRGATTVFTQDPIRQSTLLYAQPVSGANGLIDRKVTPITYLDSPATTSATTYKIQGASETATGTNQAVFQASSAVSTITLLEIGA